MTFLLNDICRVEARFELRGEKEQTLGGRTLNVALVSSGRASVFEGENAHFAGAGSLLLSSAPMALIPLPDCHIIGISLAGTAPKALAAILEAPMVLDGAACPEAAERVTWLMEGRKPDAEESSEAYALLCQLAAADPATEPLPELVAGAIAEIREHYAEVYGVEELAKELNVSKSHLVRSFSSATGVTPGRYLTAVRIEAAKRLLLHPEYTLEIVASLAGFSGANYLCKVFKKETGETPAAYRKKALPQTLVPATGHELEDMLFL